MEKETMIVKVEFIGGGSDMLLKDPEYDRDNLVDLINWFRNGNNEVFRITFGDSVHYYLARSAIKLISVRYLK